MKDPFSGAGQVPSGSTWREDRAVDEIDRVSASDLVALATDRGQVPMNLGAVLIIDKGSELDLRDVRTTVA